MWHDLLNLLANGIPLDQFGSPTTALLGAFALGLLFGAIPAGAAEVLALAAGAVQSRETVLPLLLMLTAGHVAGKLLWYWLGTEGHRITQPRLRVWITKATLFSHQHRQLGIGMLASAALVSVPPYHLMVVASGIVRMPIVIFAITSFVVRLVRFSVVALFPGVVRSFL
jgi:membrane protein YqaA with SNARE-associated domain